MKNTRNTKTRRVPKPVRKMSDAELLDVSLRDATPALHALVAREIDRRSGGTYRRGTRWGAGFKTRVAS